MSLPQRPIAAASIALVLILAGPVAAQRTADQDSETILLGVVLDATTRGYLEGASVLVEGQTEPVRTDSLGAFEVVVNVGSRRLRVEQDGYSLVILTVEVENEPRAPLEVTLDPMGGGLPVIRGIVSDAETGARLGGARVSVVGRRRGAVTDQGGAFEVVANVGPQRIAVEQYGYEDVVLTLTVQTEPGPPVDVALSPRVSLLVDATGVRGVVRDATTGRYLPGARVGIEGVAGGSLTDSRGAFEIVSDVGPLELRVEGFGYEGVLVSVEVEEEPSAPVEIPLDPEPFMIGGITVVADGLATMVRRIENRRKGASTSVLAFDLDDLMSSPAWNIEELLTLGATVQITPCSQNAFSQLCILGRGVDRNTGLPPTITPLVCLDNVPLFGGLDQLATYPLHQFFAVEVYARGEVIIAYTHWFMERVARRPIPLIAYSPATPPC